MRYKLENNETIVSEYEVVGHGWRYTQALTSEDRAVWSGTSGHVVRPLTGRTDPYRFERHREYVFANKADRQRMNEEDRRAGTGFRSGRLDLPCARESAAAVVAARELIASGWRPDPCVCGTERVNGYCGHCRC